MFKKNKNDRCDEVANTCDKTVNTDDYIIKTVSHYTAIVTKIDLQKTNEKAWQLIWTLLIVYGVIIFSILFGNQNAIKNMATIIVAVATICVTILVTIYQNGPIAALKRDYETLETILFRLIDLEKDCKDNKVSYKINTLINNTTNKMYFKK